MKVLIVGYGSIGKRHAKNLLKLNHELIICSKQKNIKLNKKTIKVLNNIDDCLKLKPKIAIITNETYLHVSTAIRLARHSVHLFIEKPLSDSSKNLKLLSKIVAEKKLITMVGCNLRFHQCVKKIKELITKKRVGKVLAIQVESGSYLPDWHPHEDYRTSYAAREDMGGGVILTCIHEMDYLFWFLGDAKEIVSISDKLSPLEVSCEDFSAIILRFQNNILAEIHLDYFQRPPIRRCKVIGTKGTLLWESTKNQVLFYDAKKDKWKKELRLENYNRNDMYHDEITYFLNCVSKNKESMNNINENIKILDAALKAKKSSQNKKVIKL